MEANFTPDTERKLREVSAQSGRGTDDLLESVVAGYLDEVRQVREMLDSRYDDLASGRVQGIDGEEAFRLLMEKTQASRLRRPA